MQPATSCGLSKFQYNSSKEPVSTIFRSYKSTVDDLFSENEPENNKENFTVLMNNDADDRLQHSPDKPINNLMR